MGNTLYRRHRLQPRTERVVEGLQGSLLQIDVSQIIIHEADEPNALVDFFDAKALTSKRRTKQLKSPALLSPAYQLNACWRRREIQPSLPVRSKAPDTTALAFSLNTRLTTD